MPKKNHEKARGLKNGVFNLAETGLILVAVPLIFQLVLSSQLSDALSKIEKQTLARLRSTAIISAASQVSLHFYSIASLLTLFRFTRDPAIADGYRNGKQAAKESGNYLIELTRDRPDQRERAEKVVSLGEEAAAIISEFERPMEMGMTAVLEAPRVRREINRIFVPIITELDTLVKQERQRLTGEQPDFDLLFKLMCVGFIANLFLSGFLALFFSRSIISRIDRLTANLRSCAERGELAPNLQGRDEFVNLDKAFHRMNDSLTAIESRKREFVAMINHDLRTPLTTLQYVVALALKGSYGEFSEDEKTQLAQQEEKLIELVDYINEFLADEKKESEARKSVDDKHEGTH